MDNVFPARWRPLVFASLILGAIILAFGYLSEDEGTNNDDAAVIPLLIVLVVLALVAYFLWKNLVGPRLGSIGSAAAQPALVLGILSILGGFFYWTGLVFAIAPAAIALGKESEADTRGKAGLVMGVIGLAGALVVGFFDAVL